MEGKLKELFKSAKMNDDMIEDNLKAKIEKSFELHAEKYIENQLQLYQEWNEKREQELESEHEKSKVETKMLDCNVQKGHN